ncbi:ankyrin repeat protein [Lentinula detonsa]|uniref:Ankyrin repeat protein n=1 Tax=Lentinula detonsa TaxID=2804962 RepID=A0AA38Q527_9AGAR|nr:ankyrin repeat protein [Lentinula detonsa]
MPHNLEAQAFIDRVLALPKGSGVSLESALQPSLEDEAQLRRLFATEKDNARLKDPYVGLVNVFDAPPEIRAIRARVVKDDEDLSAKYVMPLSPKDRKPEGTACIVPTSEEFQKNWVVFSEGCLQQLLNWNNVVAAGGSVLACLIPLPKEAKVSKRATRKYYHATAYPSSDVDLFLWGLTPEQAEAKIVTIYEAVRDSVPWDVTCVRTKHTVSIHSQYPYRSVQIVLRLYSSPAEILAGFDIDAPCCAYDGSHVWANPRAIVALMRQCNTIDVTRRSPSYEIRLMKYSSRAFEVYVPNLSRADVDPTIYERSIVRVEGLARLLVFEKLKFANAREIFLESRRTLRGRPQAHIAPFYARKKRALKGDLKNEVAIGGLEMNSYDVVSLHIPYGPGWDARRIDKLVYQTDLGMNSTYNPKNKDRRLHRHPAFFGTIEECVEDCCEYCPEPIDEDERKLQEEEDKQYIRGRISFVEQDPGRQSLSGSFNPIDDAGWSAQVYIGPTEKFFQAIVASDRAAVAHMIAEGVDVNRRDHVGRMPLHVAVLAKAEDIACDLINAGARMTSRLAEGKTALHIAAQLDLLRVVKKLLERSKTNKELLQKDGGDAHDGDGDVEMENTARDSSEDDWSSGDDGIVSMEEDENIDEDEDNDEADDDRDNDDDDDDDDNDSDNDSRRKKKRSKEAAEPPETPAISNVPEDDTGEPDVFDINAPDWDLAFTPLSYAILFASLAVIDAFLLAGANPNLVTTAVYPGAPRLHPLLLTMYRSDEEQACLVIERLLKAGAASSAADQGAHTIFHKMIEAGKTKLVSALLRLDPKAKVALNLPSMNTGWPTFPLVTAVQLNNYEMVANLLAYGADIVLHAEDVVRAQELQNQHNHGNNGNRFLSYTKGEPLDQAIHPIEAALWYHTDLVQLLIALGASVNRATRNSSGIIVDQENLRTYLDWVRFAIAWMDSYISAQKEKMEREANFVASAPTPWSTFVSKTIYLYDNGFLPGSEQQKKKLADTRTESEKTIRKCLALKGFFGDIDKLLASKGAKTYNELFTGSEKPSTATTTISTRINHFGQIYEQPSSTAKYVFLGQYEHSRDVVSSHLNPKYDELFEACWKGDDISVRRLCLPEEGKQNALRVSVAIAHPTNQWQQTNLTPFIAAIEGRHWTTVRLVFSLCVAQYKSVEEKDVVFKLGNINFDEDDDASDNDSESSDATTPAQKKSQPFIDIAQVSSAVKVPFPPSRLLDGNHVAYEEGDGYAKRSTALVKAIKTGDFEAFIHIANLYKLTEPPIELAQDYILDAILAADQPDMLDEYIRRTGCGIYLESQDDEEEEKIIHATNDKNKIYLGLSVHGKKRKDLARQNDPSNIHQDQDQDTPILWRAILLSPALQIIEYMTSTRPLEAYQFYAMTSSNELGFRLRHMTDLEKVLPHRLGWCINLLGESPLTAAILSKRLNVIKLLVAKNPKLISGAFKERIKFSGFSPLMIAVQIGCDPETIDFLLANGQSPVETDLQKWNIYHMLAAVSDPDLFEHLLQKLPKDVNEVLLQQQCKGTLNTPLHIAVSKGNYRVSSMIIDYSKASLGVRNVHGSIPLHIAISKSQAKTVQKLVEASPAKCLFMENGVGNTPLEMSILLDLLGRLKSIDVESVPELPTHSLNIDPPRIVLEKLQRDVPAIRKTITELSTNGPLKPGDKLTEELSAFARLMETKLADTKVEAAEVEIPAGEDEWNDSEDRAETLKIVEKAILARPCQRQLVRLVDVQKSVESHLNKADLRSNMNAHRQRYQRERTDEGLELEEDVEIKVRNTSIVYQQLRQSMEDI